MYSPRDDGIFYILAAASIYSRKRVRLKQTVSFNEGKGRGRFLRQREHIQVVMARYCVYPRGDCDPRPMLGPQKDFGLIFALPGSCPDGRLPFPYSRPDYGRVARDPPRTARKRNRRFQYLEPDSSGRSKSLSLRRYVISYHCRVSTSAVAVLFRNMEGLRISHYRILRRLGSGGMGEVDAAEDERLRRNVAINSFPTTRQRMKKPAIASNGKRRRPLR